MNARVPISTATLAVVFAAAWYVLYRYALGSGLGYDALEYVVIGRELATGASLYDFAPSKSPGIYALVAAIQVAGWSGSRSGVAALVATILIATAALVFLVLRRRTGDGIAISAAGFTSLIALASEINFLEPTAFVAASGVIGWALLADGRGPAREVGAGVVIGLGVLFKAVAAFYLVGAAAWLLQQRGVSWKTLIAIAVLGIGATVPVLLASGWFLASGRLDDFLFWSFGFPLLHYPSDTRFLAKLAVKLGWTLVPVLVLVGFATTKRGRAALAQPATLLACALGASAAFALAKSQASHYAFPALVFLPIALALVSPSLLAHVPRWSLGAASMLAAALLSVAVWQRPDVLQRVFARPDESLERDLSGFFARDRLAGRGLLALQGTSRTAWATGLRPILPTVATDVQVGLLLREHPAFLIQLVDANPTALIEIDPDALRTDAPALIDDPRVRAQFVALAARVQLEFERVPDVPGGLIVWRRRAR